MFVLKITISFFLPQIHRFKRFIILKKKLRSEKELHLLIAPIGVKIKIPEGFGDFY